ncbi:hypothetical protein TorRG33x02_019080 [Trema orientale]|uniref:Uncharacterized protein n=1 Tax=Trema orientale TaxID=63057 RepID=A0A2P5FWG5_TREOI|nr:hypothetical protein TorRG33x02_019080 [Trema orientale]
MTSKDLLLLPLPILTLILVPRSRLWNHFVEFFFFHFITTRAMETFRCSQTEKGIQALFSFSLFSISPFSVLVSSFVSLY